LGREEFGAARFCLPRTGLSRFEIYKQVMEWLKGANIRRVFCSPYLLEDVITAMAVKDLFGAPLCTYIMDDQNVCSSGIPDVLMKELVAKSDLRLTISPEMRIAYEKKYRQKFWLLPPLVPADLIPVKSSNTFSKGAGARGVLVGNIWGQRWLDLLRESFRNSGHRIDWFCNQKSPAFLKFDRTELENDGITMRDPLPECLLASILPQYAYAVVPSGPLDDHNSPGLQAIAELSLPSKIPFLFAIGNLPILVLGHPQTAAARCVDRLQIGAVAPYKVEAVREAVAELLTAHTQQAIRRRAAAAAKTFSAAGAAEWVWQSLENRVPVDLRFEKLMPVRKGEFAYYVDPAAPRNIVPDFLPIYRALRRISELHYAPSFIVDVGSSTGIWSLTASQVFPEARFILIDPLLATYPPSEVDACVSKLRTCELVEAAAADRSGKTHFNVSSDLYGSSLLHVGDNAQVKDTIEVELTRLDDLMRSRHVFGRGILKVDVQYAEHLVLEGGREFVQNQVDMVILELSVTRETESAKTLSEMIVVMDELGFRYFDDVGEWRSPSTGLLEQKDVMFSRHGLF
jgi:FkbM family methyltransferase